MAAGDFYVEIVEHQTGKVEKRLGPQSERMAERMDRGANINLDHERFFTRIVPDTSNVVWAVGTLKTDA